MHFRDTPLEQSRIEDLFSHVAPAGRRALDVGARDGYLSRRLADRFESIVALDLSVPGIRHARISCVAANAARLPFQDDSFDLVLCSEVLEHIPQPTLDAACREIVRVARDSIVIGVPLEQDIRVGETTCSACGRPNPPWGHVNSFTEQALLKQFGGARLTAMSHVGTARPRTNALSAALRRFARNPYGTYDQEEACVHCGSSVGPPPKRTLTERAATRLAEVIDAIGTDQRQPRPMWIHAAFSKRPPESTRRPANLCSRP